MLLFALATLTKTRTLTIHLSHIFPAVKHLLALLRVSLSQLQDVVMATQTKNHNRH